MCIKISHSSSLDFFSVTKGICGLALSWWKATSFSSSGLFFSVASCNPLSCQQYRSESFSHRVGTYNARFLSNASEHIASPALSQIVEQIFKFFYLHSVTICDQLFITRDQLPHKLLDFVTLP